jgi:hypothetical protein
LTVEQRADGDDARALAAGGNLVVLLGDNTSRVELVALYLGPDRLRASAPTAVGAELPLSVSVAGAVVTVVTDDRRLLILRP